MEQKNTGKIQAKYRYHTGLIQTKYCSGENHIKIHTHSSKYMHILFCLYWIQTCIYLIQTCLYDVCMCMYFFAHTYKVSQLLCCLYALKDTYKYKYAGSLMNLFFFRAQNALCSKTGGAIVGLLVSKQDGMVFSSSPHV